MTCQPAEAHLIKMPFALPLEIKAWLCWTGNCLAAAERQKKKDNEAEDRYYCALLEDSERKVCEVLITPLL